MLLTSLTLTGSQSISCPPDEGSDVPRLPWSWFSGHMVNPDAKCGIRPQKPPSGASGVSSRALKTSSTVQNGPGSLLGQDLPPLHLQSVRRNPGALWET